MSPGGKRVAGIGFRWGGGDQKRFRGSLHAASVSAGRLDARSRITHRQQRLLLQFSTSWLVYSLSLAVPCYALNFFQKPCSTTVSIEYSQWTGETHGRSQVVLCVVGRHGLWLGRIGSISEEGGGADHGVWGSDWSAALCQSSVELSCGHLPAANHRAPISTATLRHYRGYAIYVKRICSRDCFLCDLHHGVDDRRINLFLGVQVTTLLPLSFLPSFLPQRILSPQQTMADLSQHANYTAAYSGLLDNFYLTVAIAGACFLGHEISVHIPRQRGRDGPRQRLAVRAYNALARQWNRRKNPGASLQPRRRKGSWRLSSEGLVAGDKPVDPERERLGSREGWEFG